MHKLSYIALCIAFVFSACDKNNEQKLTIAAAANMQFAMKELTKVFTEQTEIDCETIISSSGKLTAQIKEGAPYDVFVSANMKYPNELYKAGYTSQQAQIYAYGHLVLWSMQKDVAPTIEQLNNQQIKYIAIPNPKNAPYGTAAINAMKYHSIYKNVKRKLVYGESIAQTNQFILTGSAEIGFTAKSVVLSSSTKGKGFWYEIDQNSYTPISQGVVLLKKENKSTKDAERFYNFLFSTNAKRILKNYGYSTPQ